MTRSYVRKSGQTSKYTRVLVEQYISDRKAGLSYQEVADKYGLNRQTLYQKVAEFNMGYL